MARRAEDRSLALAALLAGLVLAAVPVPADARVVVARRAESPTRAALEELIAGGLVGPSAKNHANNVRSFVSQRSLSRARFARLFGRQRAELRFQAYLSWRDEVRVHAPQRFPEIVTQRGFAVVRALDANTPEAAARVPVDQARLVRAALAEARPLYAVALEDARGERIYIGVFVYEGGRWWVAPLQP